MSTDLANGDRVARGASLPWVLICAALAAMAAMDFSSSEQWGMPGMALLLVLSRFVNWRFPRSIVISYGLRAILLVVVFTSINNNDPQDTTVWYLKQSDTNIAGYAVAADIVLRAWEKRTAAAAREGLGVVVLMTAFLFAAATDTYDRTHIQLTAPFYAMFLVLTLRQFSSMNQPPAAKRSLRVPLVLLRTIAIFLTIGFSFATIYAVTRYEYQVENWAMRFTTSHPGGNRHEIGFAMSPQLSVVFNPEPDTSRVLLIDGQLTDPHFRITSFVTYASTQWKPGPQNFSPFSDPTDPTASTGRRLDIERLAPTADLLPVPLNAQHVLAKDPLEEDESGTLRDNTSGSLEPYKVLASPSPIFQGPLAIKPDAAMRKTLLTIPPEIDPKVIQLSNEAAGTGETSIRMMRLQEYLRSHHQYSLSFNPQGEPLNDFILNNRAAHCQYFASALAIMARAIGVPSRYVTGFYAHESYGNGETVVRERDAHAWTECWIDRIGWVTFDATPSGGKPDGIFKDPPAWKRWWEKLTDLPAQVRQWLADHAAPIKYVVVFGAGIGVLIWLGRFLLRLRRRPPPILPRYAQPGAQLVEIARRFEKWMAKAGTACPPQMTWRAHLNRLDPKPPEVCDRFICSYDRARFGDSPEDMNEARTLLERVEEN